MKCLVCNKRAYSDYCMAHKPAKRIRRSGKHGKLWRDSRAIFIKGNPDKICAICGKPSTDVDHIKKRSTHPQLRYVRANLQHICRKCHIAKDQ